MFPRGAAATVVVVALFVIPAATVLFEPLIQRDTPVAPERASDAASPSAPRFQLINGPDGAPASFEYIGESGVNAVFSAHGAYGFLGSGLSLTFEGADTIAPRPSPGEDARTPTSITYRQLYAGIDLVFRATPNGVKYELRVAAGADPSAFRATYGPAAALSISSEGSLIVSTPGETFDDRAPVSYDAAGNNVACAFQLAGPATFGFSCPGWGGAVPLTIDPLVFSSFFGGQLEDQVTAVAADGFGNTYLAGYTKSPDLPMVAPLDATLSGGQDVFVLKLSTLWGIVYSTYLGGSGGEILVAMQVSPEGRVYLLGATSSPDFPFVNATNATGPGSTLTVLEVDGSIGFSTILKATDPTKRAGAVALALDEYGNVAVAGGIGNANFTGAGDGFVIKLDGQTWAADFVSSFGGSSLDGVSGVAFAPDGGIVVAGTTYSPDFPVTPDAIQGNYSNPGRHNEMTEAFIARLSPSGNLTYASFIGGKGHEFAAGVAVDADGAAVVFGTTDSRDFRVTAGALQLIEYNWSADAFVVKLFPDYRGLVWSARIGGGDGDHASAVKIDGSGAIWIVGTTTSSKFPTTPGAFKRQANGDAEPYIAKISPTGDEFLYGTMFGTLDPESASSLAFTPRGDVIVGGMTGGPDFPRTPNAIDNTLEVDGDDGFIFVLDTRTFSFEVRTDPPGRRISIDGFEQPSPRITRCAIGSTFVITVNPFQEAGDTQWNFERWSDGATGSHTVLCDRDLNLTAIFRTEYLVYIDSSPAGISLGMILTVDGADAFPPAPFWWVKGSVHHLEAPALQTIIDAPPGWRRGFTNWSDGGLIAHDVTITGPATISARYVTEALVQFDTDPPRRPLTIDGVGASGAQEFWWAVGSHHTAVADEIADATTGHRVAFSNWSDLEPANRPIRVTEPELYVASFTDEYLVTVSSDPPGSPFAVDGTNQSPTYSAWWRAGAIHLVSAPALIEDGGTRYRFSHWSDGGQTIHSLGVANATDLVVHFFEEYRATFDTIPPGSDVIVDGVLAHAPASFWWPAGSERRVAANPPLQSTAGIRWAFVSWSDGGAPLHNVTADGPLNLTVTYTREFLVSAGSPYGAVACDRPDCWYPEGATASLSVPSELEYSPGARHVFRNWTGDATGSTAPLAFTVTGPAAINATWGDQFLLTLRTRFGEANGGGWYDGGAEALIGVSVGEGVSDGTRYHFSGWTGTLTVAPEGRLLITSPTTLDANWVPEGILSASAAGTAALLAAVVAVGAGVPLAFRIARRRRDEES